ncbi:MAG TPA: hypothetical protein PLR71_01590 [Deltaproteobacteria bacterium]|nr:hypothetical protein [Deltaproteobacteria bacterium]HQI80225.1 hypothetical protein [Deltaproteobacteria bacterium]
MIFDTRQLQRIESQRRESPEVERLIAQRTRFLEEHPHLMALQNEIDSLLSTTVDPVKRLEILFMVMTERLMELRSVFGEVVRLADSVAMGHRPIPSSRG